MTVSRLGDLYHEGTKDAKFGATEMMKRLPYSFCIGIAASWFGWATLAVSAEPPKVIEADNAATVSVLDLPPGRVIYDQSEADKRIWEELAKPTEFDFQDQPLGEVARFLAEKHKIQVVLDLTNLTADGKGSDTIINKNFRGTLKSGLRLILDGEGLTFVVENEVLSITTPTAAETKVSTRVYQVHDLVVAANDPIASDPDFQSLMDLITITYLPVFYRENGSSLIVESYNNGAGTLALVVRATQDGHEYVERLLNNLRAAREPKLLDLQRRRVQSESKR